MSAIKQNGIQTIEQLKSQQHLERGRVSQHPYHRIVPGSQRQPRLSTAQQIPLVRFSDFSAELFQTAISCSGHQAASFSGVIPEIACTRLSSVTSSEVKVRMIRPWNMAIMRSETLRTSGISELMTMTA